MTTIITPSQRRTIAELDSVSTSTAAVEVTVKAGDVIEVERARITLEGAA